MTQAERVSLARQFLQKMQSGFEAADKFLQPGAGKAAEQPENILPDGEELLFQVFLPVNLKLDDVVFGRVANQQVLLSFNDFVTALDFPITINAQGQSAGGWYIRENKEFALDGASKKVTTPNGSFDISSDVIFEEREIFIPIKELEQWFDFEIKTDVSGLRLTVISEETLPIKERFERAKKQKIADRNLEPTLPLREQPSQLIDVPFVDVATNSRYDKRGNADKSNTTHTANMRTSGDFLYGTLSTQTLVNDEDKISNIRARYEKESAEADLLGPLKARRYALGDVIQARVPIDNSTRQELGFRVTNVDPLRTFTNPSTSISGNIFPGWDVELYREGQFTAFQRVDDTGFYSFDDVILFNDENNFELVFYGPQGEIRRERLSIPVDVTNRAKSEAVYDVSLTFQNEQTYRKEESLDEDTGTPTLFATIEKPLAPGTVGNLAVRSGEQEGIRDNVLYGGVSTLLGQTLVNADVSIDDEADLAAELVARRSYGLHDFFSNIRYLGENYDLVTGQNETGAIQAQFSANGPLPELIGKQPRYLASIAQNMDFEGNRTTQSTLGFNTSFKYFALSDQFNYTTSTTGADDRLNNLLALTGSYGPNRLRIRSDYEVKPENQLQRVSATYTRRFNRNTDLDLGVERRLEPLSLTEFSAQLNWLAGWARISPSIRYNTESDFFAGLNTNFGLLREPQSNDMLMFDRNVTQNGGISAFVFLDKNGDGKFTTGEDEPLKDVIVRAVQNGGREPTNENGIAYFNRVRDLRRTDVFVDGETLKDPFWIPGFEGVSVIPREGYVAEIEFPVHIAGEMDGTLYAQKDGTDLGPLKGIPVHLYNAKGEIQQTSTTDLGGFYLFSRIPPGRYLLLVDQEAAQNANFARPKPQRVEITYEGTIIYGNDIFVEANEKDIPSTIVSGLEDYKARHPHIDFENANYNIALNLGEYNSQLLMSTIWYRLHTRYRNILAGGQLMILPEHSYADIKTGKHTLRVGFQNGTLDDAYNRCHALVARDIACTVEVLPAEAKKLAMQNENGVIAK